MTQNTLFETDAPTKKPTKKQERDAFFAAEFRRLTKEKKLDSDVVIEDLANTYFLEKDTVVRILCGTGHYRRKFKEKQ
jgi:hypothetical protein